jgi:hypothetical protein
VAQAYDGGGEVTACEVYGPYHTFDVPTGDDGCGRRCACGEPQVYRRPTGEASKFSDVAIEKADLHELLAWIEGPDYDPLGNFDALMKRVQALLD